MISNLHTKRMAAKSEVNVRTTALATTRKDVFHILKSFFDIDYDKVVVSVIRGDIKIRGSRKIINRIAEGNGPKRWTVKSVVHSVDPISGYFTMVNISVAITYSDDDVLAPGALETLQSTDFVQVLTGGKQVDCDCIITVQKIDQCKYYNFCTHTDKDPSLNQPESKTPLVKVDVRKHGVDTTIDVQGHIRQNIEAQFKDCLIVWTYNDNTNLKEYWKKL